MKARNLYYLRTLGAGPGLAMMAIALVSAWELGPLAKMEMLQASLFSAGLGLIYLNHQT